MAHTHMCQLIIKKYSHLFLRLRTEQKINKQKAKSWICTQKNNKFFCIPKILFKTSKKYFKKYIYFLKINK